MSSRTITIDPITRLEGHGKIAIFLDHQGNVERACIQAPDFRGFEKFCEGRAAEEMPRLTQKICGVCPTAHHIAASKALDQLFRVTPPPAARKIRELMVLAFLFDDHLLHFYFLGGPDLIVGPQAPPDERNFFGVVRSLGAEAGRRVVTMRKRIRQAHALISGSPLDPVSGLPGGVAKGLDSDGCRFFRQVAREALDFARFSLEVFLERVLRNDEYLSLMGDEVFTDPTYYLGMIDDGGRVSFYDGQLRVVDPSGSQVARFPGVDYLEHLQETVDPLSYMKILYLRNIGWKGFTGGGGSGVYRVGPLARLNVAEGMGTPMAQQEYEKMFAALGGKPVHNVLAYHWARLIEVLHAAERMCELSEDEELMSPELRDLNVRPPDDGREGVGICEAPRGTLVHHYQADSRGVIRKANLLVATQNNAAALGLSIEKAARGLIRAGAVSEETLNRVEMAFRAYDPCLACATHCLSKEEKESIVVYDHRRRPIQISKPAH